MQTLKSIFNIFEDVGSVEFLNYYIGCCGILFIYSLGLINVNSNNFSWNLSRYKFGFIFGFHILVLINVILSTVGSIIFVDNLIDSFRFLTLMLLSSILIMIVDSVCLVLVMFSYEKGIMISKIVFKK
jgi:hypothetical protein